MRAATALLLLPAITAPALAHGHHEKRPSALPFIDDLEKSAIDTVAIQFETPCFGCAADEGEVGRLLFEFSADGPDATCSKSVLKLNGQDLTQEWNGEDAKGEGSLMVQLVDQEDQREVAASWRSHCINHKDRETMQVFAFIIHSVADVKVPEDFGFQIFLRQSPRLEIVNIEQLPLERDADGDDHEHEHHRHHGDHHHDDAKHLEKVLQHEVEELHHLEMKLDHLIHHIEHKKADIRKLEMNPSLMIDEVKECSGLNCVFATVSRKGMMIFEFLGLGFSHGPPRGPPPHGWVEGEVHDGPHGPHGPHGFDHEHEHGPHGFEHHGPPGEEFEHPHHHHHEEEGLMEDRPHHHHPWGPPPPGKWEHFGDDDFRPEHFDHHHGEHDEDFHHHHHEFDEEFDHHRHHDEKPEHDNGPEDKSEVKPKQHSGWDHHDHEAKPHDREHKNKDFDAKHNEHKEDHHHEDGDRSHPNFNSGDGHTFDDEEHGPPGPPPHGPPPPDGHPPGPPPHDGPPHDGPPHGPPPHGPPPHGPHPHHNETEHPHHPHHNETDHPHHPPPPPPGHGDHPHPPPNGPPPGDHGPDHPHPGPPGPPFDGPGGPHAHGLLPFRLSPFHFFAAFLLLITGAGLLFKFVRSRLSPTRRALRAQMAEERRNAHRVRRAGRMHRWSQWWNRYREPTNRADYEEKAALILEQEGLLEEAMENEMEVAMAEEGRAPAPAVVEHHIIYTPRSDSLIAPSTNSTIIMTPASSEAEPMLPSYEQELDDEIHVVDGFNYTPSTSSASDAGSLYHSRQVSVGTESSRDEKR